MPGADRPEGIHERAQLARFGRVPGPAPAGGIPTGSGKKVLNWRVRRGPDSFSSI